MCKEKYIEEMARTLCRTSASGNTWASSCDNCIMYYTCEFRRNSRLLYDAGYRKQNKNTILLPCAVGDTMYVNYENTTYPVTVGAIRIDTKKMNHRIIVSGTFHKSLDYSYNYRATFTFNSVGKALFYTEEDAARAKTNN